MTSPTNQRLKYKLFSQVYDETLQIMTTSFGGFPDSQMVDINRIFNIIRSVSSVELQGNNIAVVMERGTQMAVNCWLKSFYFDHFASFNEVTFTFTFTFTFTSVL